MTSPRFEYDGRTDEPHPPLRNATPLLLLVGLGGALVLVLLLAGGILALFRATRPADPATGKVGQATSLTIWDGTVAGDHPAGRAPVPDRPDRWGRPGGGDVVEGPDAGVRPRSSAATDRARR
jgi:hypothetical protein